MASTLPDALECLFSVEKIPLEIIVVNDGSSDETDKIIEYYKEKAEFHDHLSFKKHSIPNSGRANAINTGVASAEGDYVSFLDADDALDVSELLKIWNSAKKNGSDLVIGHFKIVGENDTLSAVRKLKTTAHADYIIKRIAYSPVAPLHLNAVLIKRSFFKRSGGFDTGNLKAEDKDLTIRLLRDAATVTICDTHHYIYKKHNISRKERIKKRLDWMEYRQRMIHKNFSGYNRLLSSVLQYGYDALKLIYEVLFSYDTIIKVKRSFKR
jgi:glycosyltransferase involved in cell wall biosynthesis